jgi:hypothetical protein
MPDKGMCPLGSGANRRRGTTTPPIQWLGAVWLGTQVPHMEY